MDPLPTELWTLILRQLHPSPITNLLVARETCHAFRVIIDKHVIAPNKVNRYRLLQHLTKQAAPLEIWKHWHSLVQWNTCMPLRYWKYSLLQACTNSQWELCCWMDEIFFGGTVITDIVTYCDSELRQTYVEDFFARGSFGEWPTDKTTVRLQCAVLHGDLEALMCVGKELGHELESATLTNLDLLLQIVKFCMCTTHLHILCWVKELLDSSDMWTELILIRKVINFLCTSSNFAAVDRFQSVFQLSFSTNDLKYLLDHTNLKCLQKKQHEWNYFKDNFIIKTQKRKRLRRLVNKN